MRTYLKILFICLLLTHILCLAACTESENDLISQDCGDFCATLNGIVYVGIGSEPLKNTELEVIWKNTVNLGGGIIRTKAKTQTDDTGYYELNFLVREDELKEGYYIVKIFINQEYFNCGKEDGYFGSTISELKNDTVVTNNYRIPYNAKLKIKAIGTTEMADNDYLSLDVFSPIGINFESKCGKVVDWTRETNEEYIIDIAAELPVIVTVLMRKGTAMFKTSDTLYLKKGEQRDYTAEFN